MDSTDHLLEPIHKALRARVKSLVSGSGQAWEILHTASLVQEASFTLIDP